MTQRIRNPFFFFAHLRIRMVVVVIVTFFSQLFFGQTMSDNKSFLSYERINVRMLIDSLSLHLGYDFAYDADLINADSLVSVVIPVEQSERWIDEFFSRPHVVVQFIERQVIIGRRRGHIPEASGIRIRGSVEEFGSHRPMGMVNIGVVGKPVGTTTNDGGQFEFILPNSYVGEQLMFSYLGYLSRKVTIPAQDSTLLILLPETSVRLPEVRVVFINPDDIIRQMVEQIPNNYSETSAILTAFFRETIQQDGRYVDVSEAVVEVFKPTYRFSDEPERVRFIRGRKGRETSDMDFVNFKLVGGPYNFSRLDVVRNRDFFPAIGENSRYKYSFEGAGIEYERLVYRIGFKPITDSGDLFYQGELRIDSESHALVSATFEMTSASIRRSRSYLIKRDARRFRTRPFYARYSVDYRPWGDLWVLSRVRGEVSLRIVDRDRRDRSVFHTVSEMLVSDVHILEPRTRIRWADSFRPDYVLSEQLGDFDPEFWRNYNIIKPDEALERVFGSQE